ncbi:MAG: FdrA family protein [Erysipelotrichaceae bacterium]|nr:FdrA family protein [Erysipelotrichaceae bacterium]
MPIFTRIQKDRYIDSLETLNQTAVLNDQPGIESGYVGMATDVFKEVIEEIGLGSPEIQSCTEADYVIVAEAESQDAFDNAVNALISESASSDETEEKKYYSNIRSAVIEHPRANLCQISVPGEYALEEVKKALNAGLHCCVFSNNVPLDQEREMKELASEKGLLCMGPDCGVANINGAALVLSSINNRGPFGIVGASGTGIQHVAAILHEAGTGVSQTIGTGGNDLKEPVGGITMLMGIDALEADPETKYIILISRKPADSVLEKMLARIRTMKKPRVVFFMGCDKETIEETGAIWADNLDNCALRALELIGNDYSLGDLDELKETAKKAVKGMAPEQKYVRAAYTGGTYLDEGMRTMWEAAGGIWSNAPLSPEWKLKDGETGKGHTAIDYGEEEFTLGRPHPAIDASIRRPAILKEAADPETAVIVLDFILTPPGHMDPCGYVVPDIRKAQEIAAARGGKIAFVASVLGTTADWQDIRKQEEELREAGVYVCRTNYRAALLASEIIKLRKENA